MLYYIWQEYKALTLQPDCPLEVWVLLACAMFFLGLYKEAEEAASKGRHLKRNINGTLFFLLYKLFVCFFMKYCHTYLVTLI